MATFFLVASVLVLTTTIPSVTRAEIIDLTYEFDNTTLYWFARDLFNLTVVYKGRSDEDIWFQLNRFSTPEHGGTHMDAPNHFDPDAWSIEQIPTDRMMANAAVVDISARAAKNPDVGATAEDIRLWKSRHGQFKYPTVVLVYTNYSAFWPDRYAYFGINPDESVGGVESFESPLHVARHFPGVSAGAAMELADDPAVVGLGIDTASIDIAIDSTFPAHRILAPKNIFNLENLGDMSRLPAAGARIFTFPMKIKGGSGAPCRVLVEIPEGSKQ